MARRRQDELMALVEIWTFVEKPPGAWASRWFLGGVRGLGVEWQWGFGWGTASLVLPRRQRATTVVEIAGSAIGAVGVQA